MFVLFTAWSTEVAYHSGGQIEKVKMCVMLNHLELQQAENKVM